MSSGSRINPGFLPHISTEDSLAAQEVIVTNSPIADGTVFIARTGNQDQKMVVLREEYYMKLVDHIQNELRLAQQTELAGAHRRSNSFKVRPLGKTDKSLNSIRTLSANIRKPPI